jgi:hypothetical protein
MRTSADRDVGGHAGAVGDGCDTAYSLTPLTGLVDPCNVHLEPCVSVKEPPTRNDAPHHMRDHQVPMLG